MRVVFEIFKDITTKGLEYFGRYYSTYRAFVVDNEDPDGYGRLKLMIPNISGNQVVEYWVWPKGCFSGPGYGMQVLPRKKDMVFVEFEFGNPSKPLWLHGHFGKDSKGQNEKPKELRDVDNYWFRTPNGNQVELNDKTNEITITLYDGKTKMVVTDKGISLVRNNKAISLGQLNSSSEPAVLGDKNEQRLNDIHARLDDLFTQLDSLHTALLTWTSTDGTIMTGLGLAGVQALQAQVINNKAQVIASKAKSAADKAQVSTTKSKNVTLD